MNKKERKEAIIAALLGGVKPSDIAQKFDLSVFAVYQIARRNDVEIKKLTQEERIEHIRESKALYKAKHPEKVALSRENERQKRQAERISESMPFKPAIASKMKGTALLNLSWILKVSQHLDSAASNDRCAREHGLRMLIGAR